MTEIVHGTRWAYKHHHCRCDPCTTAKRDADRRYNRKLAQELREAAAAIVPTPRPPHRRGGGPYVPADVLLALLEPLIAELGVSRVALMTSIGHRGLLDLRKGLRKTVTFNTADRLICEVLGQPALWWEIPELRAIYEQAA